MRLEEVLPALREGSRVRRPSTHPDDSGWETFQIGRDDEGPVLLILDGERTHRVDLGTEDIYSEDWEVVS